MLNVGVDGIRAEAPQGPIEVAGKEISGQPYRLAVVGG